MYALLSAMSHVCAVKLIVLKEMIHEEDVQTHGKEFVGSREAENMMNVFLIPTISSFNLLLQIKGLEFFFSWRPRTISQ